MRPQVAGDYVAAGALQSHDGDVERLGPEWPAAEELLDTPLLLGQSVFALLAHLLSACKRLDEQQPAGGGVGLQSAEQPFECVSSRVQPRLTRALRLHLPVHTRARGAESGQQAVFLSVELLVESGARNPRPRAHFGDADALVADPRAEIDHRAHEALTLGRLGPYRRHAVARLGGAASAGRSPWVGRQGHGRGSREEYRRLPKPDHSVSDPDS